MGVDFDAFMEWASDRFGPENIKLKNTDHGIEVCTHSYFAHRAGIEDHKYHLWMNPSGGRSKHHPEKGSYRCWKTDSMGTLVQLVAEYDGIDYDDAEERICGMPSLRALELKLEEYFGKQEEPETVVQPVIPDTLQLPDWTFLIDGMSSHHPMKQKAVQYLGNRKIPTNGLYVCTNDEYKDRIIIPYYNKEGSLIWYNGRLMSDKKNTMRYMKCKAKNLRQEDVLYMTSWPPPGSKIYIMEGEFDAIAMALAGFPSCAIGGKSMADVQIEMIRQYVPVLAFDADQGSFRHDSGLQATIEIGNKLLERGFDYVGYVRPPVMFKDWNKLLIEKGLDILKQYVIRYEKSFTSSTPDLLLSMRL